MSRPGSSPNIVYRPEIGLHLGEIILVLVYIRFRPKTPQAGNIKHNLGKFDIKLHKTTQIDIIRTLPFSTVVIL